LQQTQANFLSSSDLLVGVTEPLALRTFHIPQYLEKPTVNNIPNGEISTAFQITFSFVSVFFLALISLERAYALIWPLRHRVASTKSCLCAATFLWVAVIFAGALALLAVYDILDFSYCAVEFCGVLFSCLITICVSYLKIRQRLNCRDPVIDTAYNKRNESQQIVKLSRTLFIVITASLLFWIPGIVVPCTRYLCSKCVPLLWTYIFNLFRLANSLLNPIIYSFRIPMFKEIFKRTKLCKRSKQYTVNYTG